jgi:hypothetical protein
MFETESNQGWVFWVFGLGILTRVGYSGVFWYFENSQTAHWIAPEWN